MNPSTEAQARADENGFKWKAVPDGFAVVFADAQGPVELSAPTLDHAIEDALAYINIGSRATLFSVDFDENSQEYHVKVTGGDTFAAPRLQAAFKAASESIIKPAANGGGHPPTEPAAEPEKRGRGRPKGSTKAAKAAKAAEPAPAPQTPPGFDTVHQAAEVTKDVAEKLAAAEPQIRTSPEDRVEPIGESTLTPSPEPFVRPSTGIEIADWDAERERLAKDRERKAQYHALMVLAAQRRAEANRLEEQAHMLYASEV